MRQELKDIRWGVEQRLEFIEFHLFWEGGINRADITKFFGVSVPQASKDLSLYQAVAPKNITYDKSRKLYLKGEKFTPLLFQPDANRYLTQLQAVADKTLSKSDSWISEVPDVDVLRMPQRHVETDILRTTVAVVRAKQSMEIRYQSLSSVRPTPTWRWISPHAFAFDGHRWHVRAFCHIDRRFKDFLLPRFMKTRGIDKPAASGSDDEPWNAFVDVVLKPHPKLNDDQKRVIVQDYGMKSERVHIPVRHALLYYFLKRLELGLNAEKRRPQEQHVVLANVDEVKAVLEAEGSLRLDSAMWSPIT
jgi:predicted DNA-binding transcriptional regulator YafY